MNDLQVALELYTVRDETRHDFSGTLQRVARIGYAGVEFAGYGNLNSSEMSALLAETKLKAVSSHLGLDALESPQLDASIRYCQDIGCSIIVLPSLPKEYRTQEGIKVLAPRLDAIGRQCLEHGITFGYHNHDFEFTRVGAIYLLDYLLETTDPSLVKIELDVYWAAYAGVDPVSYLQVLADRVVLVHLKDMAADRSMTEVGSKYVHLRKLVAYGGL